MLFRFLLEDVMIVYRILTALAIQSRNLNPLWDALGTELRRPTRPTTFDISPGGTTRLIGSPEYPAWQWQDTRQSEILIPQVSMIT